MRFGEAFELLLCHLEGEKTVYAKEIEERYGLGNKTCVACEPRVLCVLPMLPSDFSSESVKSVLRQDVPVNQILMILNKGQGVTLPAKVSDALNVGLASVDLSSYDFLLRVDSDVVLPVNFLGSSIALGADVVGSGPAHLIRVKPFLDCMGGKFNSVSDDAYLEYKFLEKGYTVKKWCVKPLIQRSSGKMHSVSYFFDRGMIMYVNGFEPFHALGSFLWDWHNLFSVWGYFGAVLRGVPRLDVAPFVFWTQIHKLFGRLRF
jgi:hypothetical protein